MAAAMQANAALGQPPSVESNESELSKLPKIIGTEGTAGWAASEGNYGPARYHAKLPAGIYYPKASETGVFFSRHEVQVDTLLEMPDTVIPVILAEFERFWSLEPEFEKRGFVHKRGFLLHGPPGSGKTSLIQMMIKKIVEGYDGIVLFVGHPELAIAALQMLRKTEPNRPVVCLMEDLDALLVRFSESHYLSLLDGESQIGNVIFVATTNYPEKLDQRFTARPGRFDTVQFIGMPSRAARKHYLVTKEPSLIGDELERWLDLSNEFSVAHLREMILANRCLTQPIEEVCDRLRNGMKKPPKSKAMAEDNKVGFKA